jgi:hypothetical protein
LSPEYFASALNKGIVSSNFFHNILRVLDWNFSFLGILPIKFNFDAQPGEDLLELLKKRARATQPANLEEDARVFAVMIRIDASLREDIMVCIK